MPPTTTCQACGKEVTSRGNKARKWCSGSCRAWALYHPGQRRSAPPQPTRPCACGRQIHKPNAEACWHCRMAPPKRVHLVCPECGTEAERGAGAQFCSERCRKKAEVRRARARGTIYQQPWGDGRRDRYHRRRARRVGAPIGRPVLASVIFERDGWICHACGDPVDPDLRWPDQDSASLDHVVPLAEGGIHDPDNVRLAHVGCNVRRAAARRRELGR